MKMFEGYRTIAVNVLLLVVGIIGVAADSPLLIEWLPTLLIIQSAANVVLRIITDGPVFFRKP